MKKYDIYVHYVCSTKIVLSIVLLRLENSIGHAIIIVDDTLLDIETFLDME